MSNKIFWQECDYWSEHIINGRAYRNHITQELKCENPEVEKVWFMGSCSVNSNDSKMYLTICAICKDGYREEIVVDDFGGEVPEMEAMALLEKKLNGYFKNKQNV